MPTAEPEVSGEGDRLRDRLGRPAGRPRRTEIDRRVAWNLRRLRLAAGLTLADVGEAIGLSLQTAGAMERRGDRIGASRLFALAQLFDVSVDEFLPPYGGD